MIDPSAIPPLDETTRRVATLESYGILDTPPEQGFDDIVLLASQLCEVPIALVSLIAQGRQWFKARVGLPVCETDLDRSVCIHALAEPDLLVVPDLTRDARTAENPLVTGPPFLRFYAGAPLRTESGLALGSLCVVDRTARPHGLSTAQAEGLRALARQVMSQLDLRRAVMRRDDLLREREADLHARDRLRQTQTAISEAGGDLDIILDTVASAVVAAIPEAEAGVIQLIDGDQLEYRAVQGTLRPHKGLRVSLYDSLAGSCALANASMLVPDMQAHAHADHALVQRLNVRSAVLAPITHAGQVLGVLKLQSSRFAAFGERDRAQVELFAGVVSAGLTEAREAAARREIARSEAHWRGLFARLQEGFVLGELVRDAAGRVTDWRYREVNRAWGELVGLDPAAVVGQTLRTILPAVEEEWIADAARAVETGESVAFTRRVGMLERWYDGRVQRIGPDTFTILFTDATVRVQAEQRKAALLELGDRMRDLTGVAQMTYAAAEIVGRTLGACRAGFGRLDATAEHIEIDPDWTEKGQISIAGRHRFDDYGNLRKDLLHGEALIVHDVTTDPRTRDNPAPLQALGIGALVNVPVRERGRTVALFIVHAAGPRAWSAETLAFLRNVADRVEVGVARLIAEEHQAVLNRELSHRLKNTLAIVQSIAGQTLRGVAETDKVAAFDRRVLALSRAHDVLLQKNWSAARMRAVMENVLSLQAELDRFDFAGPDLDIGPQATLSLSLLLHELATNAVKYGALSSPAGTVALSWHAEPEETEPALVLNWCERGGPPVVAPRDKGGFGSRLIKLGLMGTRDAAIRYETAGLHAVFKAPLGQVQTAQ